MKKKKRNRKGESVALAALQRYSYKPSAWRLSLLKQIEESGNNAYLSRRYYLPVKYHKMIETSGVLLRFCKEDLFSVVSLHERVDHLQHEVKRLQEANKRLSATNDKVNNEKQQLRVKLDAKRLNQQRPIIDGLTDIETIIASNLIEALRKSPNKAMFINKLAVIAGFNPLSGADIS